MQRHDPTAGKPFKISYDLVVSWFAAFAATTLTLSSTCEKARPAADSVFDSIVEFAELEGREENKKSAARENFHRAQCRAKTSRVIQQDPCFSALGG